MLPVEPACVCGRMASRDDVGYGVSATLISNLVIHRFKNECLSGPWNIVACGAIGGYVGSQMEKWEADMLEDLNRRRVEKGFLPIVRDDLSLSSVFFTKTYDENTSDVIESGKKNR